MALNYDQISAITRNKFVPKMVDNIFRQIPLLERMKKRVVLEDGGLKCIQPLNYAQNGSGGWYNGAETLDTSDTDVITAAEFEWKQLYENITITRRDEVVNKGTHGVLKLVAQKMMIAEKTIMDRLATALFNDGTAAKQIAGLLSFMSTSNTYGGISQTDYSFWQASVDAATTTLSIAAMQSAYGAVTVGADQPTVGITTQTIYDLYYALLQPQQRFMDANSAKAGFQSLMFNGKPIIVDSKCASGYLFFLNEKYLDLHAQRDENFRTEPFAKPINQNVKSAKIYWMGAFTCSNVSRQSVMSAIAA